MIWGALGARSPVGGQVQEAQVDQVRTQVLERHVAYGLARDEGWKV